MSDEEKEIPASAEGDPGEADALKDLLGAGAPQSAGPVDSSVFEQNLFGSPPPPAPKPHPPQAAPPPPATPETPPPEPQTPKPPPAESVQEPAPAPPAPEPEPRKTAPPQEEEDEVKIVTPDDFDTLGAAAPPEPPRQPAPDLKVEGMSASEVLAEGAIDDDEDYPELALPESEPATVAPPEPVEEPAPESPPDITEASAESWELDSPVDESAPIDEAIEAATTSAVDGLQLATDGTPMTFKAAKAKEGAEAIEHTREFIEKLDGVEEGFLDVAELKEGMKALAELIKRVDDVVARVEAIEARLKYS